MENFAEYILNEEDLAAKMEIAYYLSKKKKILFDKSVIFKTEIARKFLNYSKISLSLSLGLLLLYRLTSSQTLQNFFPNPSISKYSAPFFA